MATTRTYTKVARAEAEQQTREALMDAARATVVAGSWSTVSLEAIAARAGVTKQTLLRHFGSRDGLLTESTARAVDEIREQRFAAPPGDIGAAVDNLIEHYERHGETGLTIGALGGEGALDEIALGARRLHYEWVEHAFGPWLARSRGRAHARLRAALIAACDLQTWWILSHDLSLDRRDVRATLVMTIERLLEEDE